MSLFKKNNGTKTVILIMTVLVFIGILIAKIYYGNINKSEDLRVLEAKSLYKKYNLYVENNDSQKTILLLDSIKNIYLQFEDYKESFEIGVVYNNIGAIWLNNALHETEGLNNPMFLDSAEFYFQKSVNIYTVWLNQFENLSENKISPIVDSYYNKTLDISKHKNLNKIKEKRIKDIIQAQIETPRRLSVVYSNLGIIYRHKLNYDEAIKYYKLALNLWDENLTAKNNINILLGRELEERTAIDKLFPKGKD